MIEIDRNPTVRTLRQFAAAGAGVCALAGWAVLSRRGSFAAAVPMCIGMWAAGAALAVAGLLRPAAARGAYLAANYATWPLRWAVSYAATAIVYYGVVVPTGLLLRLAGRDPLDRRGRKRRETYWVPHPPRGGSETYFRQF